MRTLFRGLFTIYNFLIDPQRSRGLRVAAPWCVEHATLRSNSICWKLYTENLLEAFLRLDMQIQLRKYRSIYFGKMRDPLPASEVSRVSSPPAARHSAQLLENFIVGEDLRCEAYASVLLFRWATFWSDGGMAGGGASWEDGQTTLLRLHLRPDWGPENPCSG